MRSVLCFPPKPVIPSKHLSPMKHESLPRSYLINPKPRDPSAAVKKLLSQDRGSDSYCPRVNVAEHLLGEWQGEHRWPLPLCGCVQIHLPLHVHQVQSPHYHQGCSQMHPEGTSSTHTTPLNANLCWKSLAGDLN